MFSFVPVGECQLLVSPLRSSFFASLEHRAILGVCRQYWHQPLRATPIGRSKRLPYSTVRRLPQYRTMGPEAKPKAKIDYKIPRPSSSVILISPKNEVLLLHRVKTSSSFPSAHVFPGGTISPQDGDFPPAGHPDSHDEGIHYRRAAIRELFEESGILLAKNSITGQMIRVNPAEREKGRHAIHMNETTFDQWLKGQDTAAVADTDPLVPFSHWITPQRNPRRFTTQMYLYFLPHSNGGISDIAGDTEVQVPSTDGGIEITEAQFLPATEWLRRARVGDIIMFPPQVLLLDFVAQFLDKPGLNGTSPQSISGEESTKRRAELVKFAHSGNPPWTHKFISPHPIGNVPDGRQILDLSQPGPELKGTDKKGEIDRVVLARFNKEGPREVEIRWRRDVLPNGPAKSSL
ncbi:NUDIX family hydrolase [Coccidioides immitis RS]|uniref:NUDIX family hydrolase n=1 Tax=Coccidioides immitis (strain RS) TaxID=246410 RepID=J3KDL8_COCIM|nr:NUDIX family hydrolase [Coccidioides immitis RS]EAS33474.3 NUDIX family hydrolase [Coccidioides immitis RS]